jgi:hypothetical protein
MAGIDDTAMRLLIALLGGHCKENFYVVILIPADYSGAFLIYLI